MSTSHVLQDILQAVLDAHMTDVHTCLPARVIKFNPSRNSVDVQPVLHRTLETLDGETVDEPLASIPDVPLCWPRGGGCSVTFPIAKGDSVLLVFSEQDLGLWRANGEAAGTGDTRRHGLSGAVAIPGINPLSGVLPVASDAVTIAPKVLLGSTSAAQALVKGTAYRSAEDTLFAAISAAASTLSASGSPTEPAAIAFASALVTALGNFATAAGAQSGFLSTKHKLDS
jgi:hypothetical protein